MRREDYETFPCVCAECVQAGVSDKPQRRDRYTGKWLHGYDLKRNYEAEAKFWEQFKATFGR